LLARTDTEARPGDGADAGASGDGDPLRGRRFLIVSAPFGPFSRHLAAELRRRGASVTRVLFNAGDLMDWGGDHAIRFQQGPEAWPEAFRALANDGFTDILTFGEGGPYNRAVLDQAASARANVWVLENGYFRPHWITVERNGVNARSNLPRSADGYPAPPPEEPPFQPAGRILPAHVVNLSLYHLIQLPGRPLFPRYGKPYTQPAWKQCAGHIWRFIRLRFTPRSHADAARIAARGPFFLVCLQREGDAQLLAYSAFKSNAEFMARVFDSFAAHADPADRLVVKNHPLDPGLIDLKRQTLRLAAERGLAGRVDFIDGGLLAQLCRASRGMVVNNSTAALSALGFGTPVKVLGDAFFDFEGLTDQKPLDAFWAAPTPADHDLFVRFRAHVMARTQVNGNYHDRSMRDLTIRNLTDFLARRIAETHDA